MTCPRCTGETRVISTRKPNRDMRAMAAAQRKASRVVDWYSPDCWTVRTRKCHACAAITQTVEVYVDDMTGMLLSAERGERPC